MYWKVSGRSKPWKKSDDVKIVVCALNYNQVLDKIREGWPRFQLSTCIKCEIVSDTELAEQGYRNWEPHFWDDDDDNPDDDDDYDYDPCPRKPDSSIIYDSLSNKKPKRRLRKKKSRKHDKADGSPIEIDFNL